MADTTSSNLRLLIVRGRSAATAKVVLSTRDTRAIQAALDQIQRLQAPAEAPDDSGRER